MNNAMGYKLPHGKLYVYGENLHNLVPYMDGIINSVFFVVWFSGIFPGAISC